MILGSEKPFTSLPKITARGLSQVRPSILSAGGGGVSRLIRMNIALQMQNTHQACIMKEIPQRWVTIFSVPNTGSSSTKDAAPIKKPVIRVTTEASLVPRRQNTPNRKTVVIGGARSAAITLMASKMLE